MKVIFSRIFGTDQKVWLRKLFCFQKPSCHRAHFCGARRVRPSSQRCTKNNNWFLSNRLALSSNLLQHAFRTIGFNFLSKKHVKQFSFLPVRVQIVKLCSIQKSRHDIRQPN